MQTVKQLLAAAGGTVGDEDSPPPRDPDTDLGHADVPPAHRPPHGHALPDPAQRAEGEEGHPWPQQAQGGHGLHLPAPLERMKESAVHAVEGVALRLHLSGAGGGGAGTAAAEERTGESMHMAKAAEGRNMAEDNPIDHALHDALKLERGEKPETSAFPETLDDALSAAQMRDLPASPVSAAATALGGSGGGGGGGGGNPGPEGEVPPVEGFSANPFNTQQTRAKLQYTPDEEEVLLDEASHDPVRGRQRDMAELRKAVREDRASAGGGESEEELLQEASANPIDDRRRRELEELRREVGQEQPSGAGAADLSEAALLREGAGDQGSSQRQADLEGLRNGVYLTDQVMGCAAAQYLGFRGNDAGVEDAKLDDQKLFLQVKAAIQDVERTMVRNPYTLRLKINLIGHFKQLHPGDAKPFDADSTHARVLLVDPIHKEFLQDGKYRTGPGVPRDHYGYRPFREAVAMASTVYAVPVAAIDDLSWIPITRLAYAELVMKELLKGNTTIGMSTMHAWDEPEYLNFKDKYTQRVRELNENLQSRFYPREEDELATYNRRPEVTENWQEIWEDIEDY
ncbi:hypothetical protein C2E21_6004 [Chlorella sorokiniana]|uniref:Uncharacterized protein n=1 Tax=Chlorella sorokiniana TaxID=3076 RepID=A0A2P6TMS1_CHLSO|nr:hypothetical protein C2E21_6004 [Chlorella sorokiniana]|eukprot:PRW45637.1 hypothetical protein C2E21_6004 [Chlorella sorokiniana]